MRLQEHLNQENEKPLNENGASIHTNKAIEKELRKVGFDIPMYPKQGKVYLNGEQVGFMDNFSGLTIYYKSTLDLIRKTTPKAAIWNPTKAV